VVRGGRCTLDEDRLQWCSEGLTEAALRCRQPHIAPGAS
jgi:hypothetical protein